MTLLVSEATVNTGISLFGFVATKYVRARPANDGKNATHQTTCGPKAGRNARRAVSMIKMRTNTE